MKKHVFLILIAGLFSVSVCAQDFSQRSGTGGPMGTIPEGEVINKDIIWEFVIKNEMAEAADFSFVIKNVKFIGVDAEITTETEDFEYKGENITIAPGDSLMTNSIYVTLPFDSHDVSKVDVTFEVLTHSKVKEGSVFEIDMMAATTDTYIELASFKSKEMPYVKDMEATVSLDMTKAWPQTGYFVSVVARAK